jgi:copper chaperone NosL
MAMAAVALAVGCTGGRVSPVPIEPGVPCAFCRMSIADARLAAEVVAPGEEPRQYDDIGCLAADLAKRPLAAGARAFVADYRSGTLLPAADAVYTRVETIATPMLSHLVAHESDQAREADARTRGGTRLLARDVFGAAIAKEEIGGR